MINGIWRCSLLDVKVKRSADVGRDHYLMTSLIKIKPKELRQIITLKRDLKPRD